MSDIKVGDRVVYTGSLKGVVGFIGTTSFSTGVWCGVKLDLAKGKNDGSVNGKVYFKCEKNHGIFVRTAQLTKIEDDSAKEEEKPKPPVSGLRKPSVVKTNNRMLISEIIESFEEPPQSVPEEPAEKSVEKEDVKDEFSDDCYKVKIKDLEEKLQTIQIKRSEDKEKLKEYEKSKLFIQQLEENKKMIQDKAAEYQRALDKIKQDYSKLNEEFEAYREETSVMSENIEMLTIDKEMAEEKVDTFQQQIDELNGKVEELSLENEILKLEQRGGPSAGGSGVDETQLNILKTQNNKLRDAIIVMRDMNETMKADNERLTKEVSKMDAEFDKTSKERNRLVTELKEAQESIIELKEQVDSALGADEMVSSLTDKNLRLEERLKTLEDEKLELEELCDMNNEIIESNTGIISELQNEISVKNIGIQELNKALVSKNECILDYEDTIEKFRELVKDLQGQIKSFKSQQLDAGPDSIKTGDSSQVDVMKPVSFKTKASEIKELADILETKLIRIEVNHSTKQIATINKFMPEKFFRLGGENESILMVLFVDRMICKVELLLDQVKDVYLSEDVESKDPVSEHAPRVYFQRLCFLLNSWYLVLRHFKKTLSTCSDTLFTRLVSLYLEMSPNEKSLDYLLELIRKGHLDRQTSLEPLERSINYFHTFYQVHIAGEQPDYCHRLLDFGRVVSIGSEFLSECCRLIEEKLTQHNASESIQDYFKKILQSANDFSSGARNIRKNIMKDTVLVYNKEVIEKLDNVLVEQSIVIKILDSYCSEIVTMCENEADFSTFPLILPHIRKQPEVKATDDEAYLPGRCAFIGKTALSMSDSVEQGEFDCHNPQDSRKIEEPISALAQKFKNELSEFESSCSKLVQKDDELKRSKVSFKLKCDEISEMSIRLSVAEKKLSSIVKEKDEIIERLEQKFEQVKASLSRKERELDQTSEALQSDINQLETQKEELKKQMKESRKRNFFDNMNTTCIKSSEMESQSFDIESLLENLKTSKQIICRQRKEICKLRHEIHEMKSMKKLNWSKEAPVESGEVQKAMAMSKKATHDIYEFMSSIKVVDISAKSSTSKKLENVIGVKTIKNNFEKIETIRNSFIESHKLSCLFSPEVGGDRFIMGRINFRRSDDKSGKEKMICGSNFTVSKIHNYFY